MQTRPEATRWYFVPGMLAAVALGLLTGGLGLSAAWHGMDFGLPTVLLLLYFGAPLAALVALHVLALLLTRGAVPRWVWRWTLGPVCMGALPWVLGHIVKEERFALGMRNHPPVSETHINLSGRDLMPDGRDFDSNRSGFRPAMAGDAPERFGSASRWHRQANRQGQAPEPDQGYDALYATGPRSGSVRLKAQSLQRWALDPAYAAGGEPPAGERVPLVQVQPVPDVSGLPGPPNSVTEWLYVHYADRTEVAPVVALSGMHTGQMAGRWGDWVRVQLMNGGPSAVVRWQINGQELRLGSTQAVLPHQQSARSACGPNGGYMKLPAANIWRVRWQTVDAPGTWHAADVAVPAFAAGPGAARKVRESQVDLHLLPDGRWLAQRVQFVDLPQQLTGIRATPLPARTACGGAGEGWDPARFRILPP